MINEEEEQKR